MKKATRGRPPSSNAQVIGDGGFGCVFTPPMKCVDKPFKSTEEGLVGKVFLFADEARTEVDNYALIKKLDPKREWSLPMLHSCTIDAPRVTGKCAALRAKTLSVAHQIIMTFGGSTIREAMPCEEHLIIELGDPRDDDGLVAACRQVAHHRERSHLRRSGLQARQHLRHDHRARSVGCSRRGGISHAARCRRTHVRRQPPSHIDGPGRPASRSTCAESSFNVPQTGSDRWQGCRRESARHVPSGEYLLCRGGDGTRTSFELFQLCSKIFEYF